MHLHFATDQEEKTFGYCKFNRNLRQSGIYVDSNSMSGGLGDGGISHLIYGDEEAIEYYYQLWQSGYRGEIINDPLLKEYIKRGIEKDEYMCDLSRSGPTGIQG